MNFAFIKRGYMTQPVQPSYIPVEYLVVDIRTLDYPEDFDLNDYGKLGWILCNKEGFVYTFFRRAVKLN